MMKKLMIALVAISCIGSVDARSCSNGKKACKEVVCREVANEPCHIPCIRPVCVVKCETSYCEGDKPSICALEPARVDVIKHVDTNVWYSCADKKECQVVPTQEQVDYLISIGSVPKGTKPCPPCRK